MDLTAVPGLPETALAPDGLADLPPSAPPAPWELELEAVLWGSRPVRGGATRLPAPRLASVARQLAGGGGFVRYLDTPVGPYAEALAGAVLLHDRRVVVHVPFMAVDSAQSVVGGRANWCLPKTLAGFDGAPGASGTVRAATGSWEVRATARGLGPAFPFSRRFSLVQERPDGSLCRAIGQMSGRARPAYVTVSVSGGPHLRRWLRAGRRLGVIVESARGVLGPAY